MLNILICSANCHKIKILLYKIKTLHEFHSWKSTTSVRPKKAIGGRGFAMVSPTEWNRPPLNETDFKSQNRITGCWVGY